MSEIGRARFLPDIPDGDAAPVTIDRATSLTAAVCGLADPGWITPSTSWSRPTTGCRSRPRGGSSSRAGSATRTRRSPTSSAPVLQTSGQLWSSRRRRRGRRCLRPAADCVRCPAVDHRCPSYRVVSGRLRSLASCGFSRCHPVWDQPAAQVGTELFWIPLPKS